GSAGRDIRRQYDIYVPSDFVDLGMGEASGHTGVLVCSVDDPTITERRCATSSGKPAVSIAYGLPRGPVSFGAAADAPTRSLGLTRDCEDLVADVAVDGGGDADLAGHLGSGWNGDGDASVWVVCWGCGYAVEGDFCDLVEVVPGDGHRSSSGAA